MQKEELSIYTTFELIPVIFRWAVPLIPENYTIRIANITETPLLHCKLVLIYFKYDVVLRTL